MAAIVAIWQLQPVFDAVIFTEAEGADLAEINRRQHYRDRLDIAKLQLEHEVDADEIAQLKAEIEYYENRLRQMDEGEK